MLRRSGLKRGISSAVNQYYRPKKADLIIPHHPPRYRHSNCAGGTSRSRQVQAATGSFIEIAFAEASLIHRTVSLLQQ